MNKTPQALSLGKWNTTDRIKLLENITLLLDNGFSLNEGLQALPGIWHQREHELFRINELMRQNRHFALILAEIGFSLTTTTQIGMALEEGTLRQCLRQLTGVLVLRREQMKKIKQEMAYPVVIIVMMSFLMIFMRVFMGNYLPKSPAADWQKILWLLLGVGILVIIYCVYYAIKSINEQSYAQLLVLRSWPVIGKMVLRYAQYLILFNLNILLSNGFSLQDICGFALKQPAGSLQYQLGLNVKQKLVAGRTLQEIITAEPFLSDELLFVVNTGSERMVVARQIKILEVIAYEELSAGLQRLSLKIQPLSFIVIGIGILTMYLKLLMPVYSMMQGF